MPEFKTRFNLNEVVYILSKDNDKPEPVIITDIRIHISTMYEVIYHVSYRGITDVKQKDFRESELGTLSEAKAYYQKYNNTEIPELDKDIIIGDLPKKKLTTEDSEYFKYFPWHQRP